MKLDLKEIYQQAHDAMAALLEAANLQEGDIVVIGCSTSEVCGAKIGSASSEEVAKVLMDAILPQLQERKLYLAAQCCEHLNRAIVIERKCAKEYHLDIANVVPALHAGGAFSVQAFNSLENPVVVEEIRAHAGMDIGDTLIGMHLRPVVVPVRALRQIGCANVVLARTRPKYIGGPRAQYVNAER